jgi:dynein heavy chain
MMDYSDRWSLCIDPQMQANNWLKKQYKSSGKEDDVQVYIVKPTMSTAALSRRLENCISMGFPVILEDATETFDPMLDPLLSKQIEKKSSETLMKFGDKMISYNMDFKFFITTKMPSPHYSPEVCVKVTILNFMVTQEGLQDQMLNEIIRIDEAKKFEMRIKCIQQKADNTIQKKNIDDTILNLLANSKEDILEDTDLRESLAESKEK